MAVTSSAHVKLATENGRRVGKIAKAKRVAAQPAMEAARLLRSITLIKAEAEKASARSEQAKRVLEAAWLASSGEDRLIARAMAREALIECSYALSFEMVIRCCEMAEEGTLCA